METVTQFGSLVWKEGAIKIREANIFLGPKKVIYFVRSKEGHETLYSRKMVRKNHNSEGHFRLTGQAMNTWQGRPGWDNTIEVHFSMTCSLCNLRKRTVAFSDCCLPRELFFLVSSGQFFSEGLAVHQKMKRTWTILSSFSLWLTLLTLAGIQTCHILMRQWISQLWGLFQWNTLAKIPQVLLGICTCVSSRIAQPW